MHHYFQRLQDSRHQFHHICPFKQYSKSSSLVVHHFIQANWKNAIDFHVVKAVPCYESCYSKFLTRNKFRSCMAAQYMKKNSNFIFEHHIIIFFVCHCYIYLFQEFTENSDLNQLLWVTNERMTTALFLSKTFPSRIFPLSSLIYKLHNNPLHLSFPTNLSRNYKISDN